jgi:hypothetical protein
MKYRYLYYEWDNIIVFWLLFYGCSQEQVDEVVHVYDLIVFLMSDHNDDVMMYIFYFIDYIYYQANIKNIFVSPSRLRV